MEIKFFGKAVIAAACLLAIGGNASVMSQTNITVEHDTTGRFLDKNNGTSADEAVRIGLLNNGEIVARRREVDAARALVKQAGLRANPKLEANGSRQVGGMDNSMMFEGMLPLELGGRRGARVRVAEAELELRELDLANQERMLAADIRSKFGEALSLILKLDFHIRLLADAEEGYGYISASVAEGRIAPLEENMILVELNRLRSHHETLESQTQIAMLELRNLMGLDPEEPLRLKGGFDEPTAYVPQLDLAIATGLSERPDLLGARAAEKLAEARGEQARSEGRIDATLKSGYQRMNSGFPVRGFDAEGALRPVQAVFNFYTFGVEFDLPVRNRNQGAVEAAAFEKSAARRRIEFGEITVRREINSAFVRYQSAVRSLSIFRNGVRGQAAENLRIIWQTYQLGKRTLSEYISEEQRFMEIESDLIDAELEAYLARIEILRAANAPELKK